MLALIFFVLLTFGVGAAVLAAVVAGARRQGRGVLPEETRERVEAARALSGQVGRQARARTHSVAAGVRGTARV